MKCFIPPWFWHVVTNYMKYIDPNLFGPPKISSKNSSTHSQYFILASIRNWLFVLASKNFKMQVHIANFLYLQVQKIGYVYLQAKFQIASTHSHFFVLASTEKWLCVLAESMNSFTLWNFKFEIANFKFQIWKFEFWNFKFQNWHVVPSALKDRFSLFNYSSLGNTWIRWHTIYSILTYLELK